MMRWPPPFATLAGTLLRTTGSQAALMPRRRLRLQLVRTAAQLPLMPRADAPARRCQPVNNTVSCLPQLGQGLYFPVSGFVCSQRLYFRRTTPRPTSPRLTPPSRFSPDSSVCPRPCPERPPCDRPAAAAAPRGPRVTAIRSAPAGGWRARPRCCRCACRRR